MEINVATYLPQEQAARIVSHIFTYTDKNFLRHLLYDFTNICKTYTWKEEFIFFYHVDKQGYTSIRDHKAEYMSFDLIFKVTKLDNKITIEEISNV